MELDFLSLLQRPPTAKQLFTSLDIHKRCISCLVGTLLAPVIVQRNGEDAAAIYLNTPHSHLFSRKSSFAYMSGLLELYARPVFILCAVCLLSPAKGEPRLVVLRKRVTTSDLVWNAYLGGES